MPLRQGRSDSLRVRVFGFNRLLVRLALSKSGGCNLTSSGGKDFGGADL
jgi:hypothetical protein